MPKGFNEATRVQLPALVHLDRLGWEYYGKLYDHDSNVKYDPDTNILLDVFKKKFIELNPEKAGEFEQVLKDIKLELDNDDLGKTFYKRLLSVSPIKLIDFENIDKNDFHTTGEFTCRRDNDEFRPDITLFVNGLPLCFIEVKKPNNKGGMIAEATRMNNARFPNKKFRRFLNITQLMIFSNNMEYDTLEGISPVQGTFYCTNARSKAFFNLFREENPLNQKVAPFNKEFNYKPINPLVEKKILTEFNCQVLHTAPEYQTNLDINTPLNRVLTSMCSKERFMFLLKYGFAYVNSQREVDGKMEYRDEKHIMRYQQMFASLAVRDKITKNIRSGVIWHTQGSGKTALSYHLTYVLRDYFAKKDKVTKFYFIVDRLDLMEQAMQEFAARGLSVKTANTREELMKQFETQQAQEGVSGENEITVVNIQRFAEKQSKIKLPPYAINLQRVFIVDEAHRGYKPEGSFLANLFEADPNSIKIALTGTPLLKAERASWKVFGNYYHTYYYDKSIEDGYTLKVIREPIKTQYKESLSKIYKEFEVLIKKEELDKSQIIEHPKYCDELLRYIIDDLKEFRTLRGDNSLGGMIICETSGQARKLAADFDKIQNEMNNYNKSNQSHFVAKLVLHDSDDKETRKQIIYNFKKNFGVDILIVFNMLLTGFDAPRLKRLYFNRNIKDHNLLQAITRVNRPYKDQHYGYVIDFADIKQEFEKTNQEYMQELSRFNDPNEVGPENTVDTFKQVLQDPDALITEVKKIESTLFSYTTDNAEIFSSEISTITDKDELLKLKKGLTYIKDAFNIVRSFGDEELKAKFDKIEIKKLSSLLSEVQHCIDSINTKEAIAESESINYLVNEKMKNITFKFTKEAQEELKIIDGGENITTKYHKVINGFVECIDADDPEYITLNDAFLKRCREHNFEFKSANDIVEYSKEMDEILKKLEELNRKNNVIRKKYNGDIKFARVHKRIVEENQRRKNEGKKALLSDYEDDIKKVLFMIKDSVDQKVYDRNDILKKDAYFKQTVMQQISDALVESNIDYSNDDAMFIETRLATQYLQQYNQQFGTNYQ